MRKLAAVLALVLLPLASARAQFCPGVSPFVFNDVLASDPFCGSITFLAQNNVTLGCLVIDANNRLYCPADSVRRDQMAGFMFRLTEALFPTTCAPGQVRKWNGLAWTCADDNIGGSGGGGTVTSVAAGTGLAATPNPIVGAGVINLLAGFQLPQNCGNGQVAKSNGSNAWACGNDLDTNAGGTVTSLTQGAGIVLTPSPITTIGTVSADTAFLQRRVTGTCPAGSSIRTINADGTVVCEADDVGTVGNAFLQGGNAFGAAAILGTTDTQSLDVRVGGERVVRFQFNPGDIPSIVGGYLGNQATGGAAFVGGGGAGGTNCFDPVAPSNSSPCRNLAAQPWSVVGGGIANVAGAQAVVGGGNGNNAGDGAVVGGGFGNLAGIDSVVSGGVRNSARSRNSTIGGGRNNVASQSDTIIAGGQANEASAFFAAVLGGTRNRASGIGSAVLGGGLICVDPTCTSFLNVGSVASGLSAAVPGGAGNRAGGDFSLAAGRSAVVRDATESGDSNGDEGTFVWSDTREFDFVSVGPNEFAARASGGVRFVTKIDRDGLPTETFAIVPGDVGRGQRVGISTATPEAPLHVVEGSAGVSGNAESSIVTERDTVNFISILAPRTVEAGVLFGSPADAQDGGVIYDHNDRSLAFRTNGNMNRMRIFANGSVGIARNSASHPIHVGTTVLNGNGAHVTAAGVWTNGSSRSFKEGFAAVDARDVLERVAVMPIASWSYVGEAAKHIGPTAEDFNAAFGLGGDERYIGTVDADGVALAAIQGLNAKVEAQAREIEALKRMVEQLLAVLGDGHSDARCTSGNAVVSFTVSSTNDDCTLTTTGSASTCSMRKRE